MRNGIKHLRLYASAYILINQTPATRISGGIQARRKAQFFKTKPICEKVKSAQAELLQGIMREISNWTLGENKPKQSQFQDGLLGQSRLRWQGNTHYAGSPLARGQACPCESRGNSISLPRSGLYKLPSNKALAQGRPPGRSLIAAFCAEKPWLAGQPRPFESGGR